MSQHISGRITSCVLYEQLFVFVCFLFFLLWFFRFFAIEANDKSDSGQSDGVCVLLLLVGYWICVSVTVKDLLPRSDLHVCWVLEGRCKQSATKRTRLV